MLFVFSDHYLLIETQKESTCIQTVFVMLVVLLRTSSCCRSYIFHTFVLQGVKTIKIQPVTGLKQSHSWILQKKTCILLTNCWIIIDNIPYFLIVKVDYDAARTEILCNSLWMNNAAIALNIKILTMCNFIIQYSQQLMRP